MPTVFVEKWSFPARVDVRCTGRSDRQVYGTKKQTQRELTSASPERFRRASHFCRIMGNSVRPAIRNQDSPSICRWVISQALRASAAFCRRDRRVCVRVRRSAMAASSSA